MTPRLGLPALAVGLVATLLARPAAAQDPRLERLEPSTRPLVAALIDSARAFGLPAEQIGRASCRERV